MHDPAVLLVRSVPAVVTLVTPGVKETYKGEIKADKDPTKFVQNLITLLSQLMQLRLSSSNEMTDQLRP